MKLDHQANLNSEIGYTEIPESEVKLWHYKDEALAFCQKEPTRSVKVVRDHKSGKWQVQDIETSEFYRIDNSWRKKKPVPQGEPGQFC